MRFAVRLLMLLLLAAIASPTLAQNGRPSALDFDLNKLGGFGDGEFGGPLGGAADLSDAKLDVRFAPKTAAPGDEVTLKITIDIPRGAHVYAQQTEAGGPTEIAVELPPSLQSLEDGFTPDRAPKEKPGKGFFGPAREFEGSVTFSRRFRVKDTAAGQVTLNGSIDFQVCDTRCVPYDETFSATLTVAAASDNDDVDDGDDTMAFGSSGDEPETAFGSSDGAFGEDAAAFGEGSETTEAAPEAVPDAAAAPLSKASRVLAELAARKDAVAQPLAITPTLIASTLFWCLVGGIVLNVMPCVLPVLTIKAMSLVALSHGNGDASVADSSADEHAGSHRREARLQAIGYTVGVLAVMIGLGIAMISLRLAWGQQFQSPAFVASLAVIVFALSLSLLGVYELPIPGFVGRAGAATQKEGFGGALFSGVFATVLATPCIGPGLATVMGLLWRMPPWLAMASMLTIGLGLALPFLLIGFFPKLVAWLPRPGMWMVRFKQISGFVLLGTVIYLLTPLATQLVVPLLIAMLGVAFALWTYGEFAGPEHPAARRMAMSVLALLLLVGGGYAGYRFAPKNPDGTIATQRLAPRSEVAEQITPAQPTKADAAIDLQAEAARVVSTELPWRPFDEDKLIDLLADRETVLVDFTADWCVNCKANEAIALNTERVRKLVEAHGIETMIADWTTFPPADERDVIREWINAFGRDAIPLTVIFPKGSVRDAIILDAAFTQSTLLDRLERAIAYEPTDVAAAP